MKHFKKIYFFISQSILFSISFFTSYLMFKNSIFFFIPIITIFLFRYFSKYFNNEIIDINIQLSKAFIYISLFAKLIYLSLITLFTYTFEFYIKFIAYKTIGKTLKFNNQNELLNIFIILIISIFLYNENKQIHQKTKELTR